LILESVAYDHSSPVAKTPALRYKKALYPEDLKKIFIYGGAKK
jgi:hypothetical protein